MQYHMVLYLIMLFASPFALTQEKTAGEAIMNNADTESFVRARLRTYTNCSQNGNNPVFKEEVKNQINDETQELCVTRLYTCSEKGNTGESNVVQKVHHCFPIKDIVDEHERRRGNSGGGGDCPNGDCYNGGGNDGTIIVDDGSDFCHMGAGCSPCDSKCRKFIEKGKSKKKCIRCLEKNGYYCLASMLSGNRGSCSEGTIRYSCSNCHRRGGGDYEDDCSSASKHKCYDDNENKRRRENDDCPECNRKPYPPGTGFLNVMTGLGNFIQQAGYGVGASGLMQYLTSTTNLKTCKDWYSEYNKLKVDTDNPAQDWDCEKYAGAGGFFGGAGGGVIPPMPPYGQGGFGYNPGFPGNFQGPYGNYNPYGGMGGLLGGLLGGGITGNINFGGGVGGNFGSPYSQPWFGQGANGLPYNPAGGYPGYPGGQYPGYPGGQYPGYPGGQYPGYPGGQYPGYPGGQYPGGYPGGYPGSVYNGGGYPGGYPPQGNSSYWQDRMMQEKGKYETAMGYLAPQPINANWPYNYPGY